MPQAPNPYDFLPPLPALELSSNDFRDGDTLAPAQRSGVLDAGGDDVSPQLSWRGFPASTRSFAVTCFDPDAPTASGYWHWAVFDLSLDVTGLASGAGTPGSKDLPQGAVSLRNDAGFAGYVGAAPPEGHGAHRYFYVVHAVDVPRLGIDPSASPANLGFNLFIHGLARGVLVGRFGR